MSTNLPSRRNILKSMTARAVSSAAAAAPLLLSQQPASSQIYNNTPSAASGNLGVFQIANTLYDVNTAGTGSATKTAWKVTGLQFGIYNLSSASYPVTQLVEFWGTMNPKTTGTGAANVVNSNKLVALPIAVTAAPGLNIYSVATNFYIPNATSGANIGISMSTVYLGEAFGTFAKVAANSSTVSPGSNVSETVTYASGGITPSITAAPGVWYTGTSGAAIRTTFTGSQWTSLINAETGTAGTTSVTQWGDVYIQLNGTPVPAPGSLPILAAGALPLAGMLRRRFKRRTDPAAPMVVDGDDA